MAWRIGADIGGTFIDFCALDTRTNRLESLKVLTTPEAPGRELMDGLALLERHHGVDPADIEAFVHGTTVGINTIIQRKGAKLALVTTAGFEDVIELARLRMPEMYSLFCSRPEPLIARDLVFGVPERMLADGGEAIPLDEDALAAALAHIQATLGAGLGLVMPNLTVAIQNSVERSEMGSATSFSSFVRSLGGALGVAVSGAVVAIRLRHLLPASWTQPTSSGQASILELGVQQLASLPADRHLLLMHAYRHAIATTFLTGAGIAALAFGIVLFLPERPLRSSAINPADEGG